MTSGTRLTVGREAGTPYPVTTPEGVELGFTLARAGDRLGAFLLDSFLMLLLMFLLVLFASIATGGLRGSSWLWAVVLLVLFLLQNFYFVYFESRGRGTTPGKRRMGIRVMDGDGGSLTAGAVVVRNAMRNLEVNLPLMVLLAPEALWPGAPSWARLLASVWLVVLAAMPLFNRRRLRVGDMVAGTVVVVAPQAVLLADLGREETSRPEAEAADFHFTDEQLDVYGEYELQVLEDLLRNEPGLGDQRQARRAVAGRIAKKIGWKESLAARDTERFLLDFYRALRARLEQRMLFGRRKRDKHSRG